MEFKGVEEREVHNSSTSRTEHLFSQNEVKCKLTRNIFKHPGFEILTAKDPTREDVVTDVSRFKSFIHEDSSKTAQKFTHNGYLENKRNPSRRQSVVHLSTGNELNRIVQEYPEFHIHYHKNIHKADN